MRLIDADAIKYTARFTDYADGRMTSDAVITKCEIDSMPTVDPVKHGRWVEQEHGDWRFSKEYRCSECGKYRLVTSPVGWEWHYCPNCGAKMDGDEE